MIWSMACGSYTLFAIEDGWFFRDPLVQFPDSDREIWRRNRQWLGEDGRIRISVGCFLLTDGSRAVMIDAGAGSDSSFLGDGASSGRMPQALAMVGVRPDDVRTVIHTHLHLDHIGGDRTATGEAYFENARHLVQTAELDYWMGAEGEAADRIRVVMSGLVEEGRVVTVDGEHAAAPGVTLIPTAGHTPGHQSVVVMSRRSRTFITGDVTHHPVQVSFPDWGIPFDVDPAQATRTRTRVFQDLAGSGSLMAAGHYPRPGMGYVEVVDGVRVFVTGTPLQVA